MIILKGVKKPPACLRHRGLCFSSLKRGDRCLLPAHQTVVLLAAAKDGETAVEAFFAGDLVVEGFGLGAVDGDAAALDEGTGFGLGLGQAGGDEGVDQAAVGGFERDARHAVLGQLFEVVFGQLGLLAGGWDCVEAFRQVLRIWVRLR